MGHEAPAKDRTWAVFGVASAVAFALIWARSEMTWTQDHDGFHYTVMSQAGVNNSTVTSPFRNRVLTPWLASMLPHPWGFVTVTALGIGAAVAALERLLRSLTSRTGALIGVALLAGTSTVQAMLTIPFRVDAVTLAAACITLVLLHEQRWLPLVAVMPLAVANHELALLLLVPVTLTAWRQRRLPDAALLVVVSAAVWWALHRSGVIPVNDRATFLDAAERERIIGWNLGQYRTLAGAIWTQSHMAFGAALLLAPFGWRRAPQLARDAAWMAVPAAVLCLGATQWYRVVVVLVPVVVVVACAGIEQALMKHHDSRHVDVVEHQIG